MHKEQAIGIFDSGIGGLTVAKAIAELLPNESMIYFGDTYHSPWGDKSPLVLEHYVLQIVDFLLAKKCKAIVIACNTASALSYELVKKHVGAKAIVVDVIEPTVAYIKQNNFKKIGLIATKQTIASKIYANKLQNLGLDLRAKATPLLASLVEEGFANTEACRLILAQYLSFELKDIEALVLACTHYPLLKPQIKQFYQNINQEILLIDSAEQGALYLAELLKKHDLQKNSKQATQDFYISDYNEHFVKIAEQFFPQVKLEAYNIWDL